MKMSIMPSLCRVLGFSLLVLAPLLFFHESWAAGEESFLGAIKETTAPFDDSSVEQVQPVVEETVLALEQYQGGSFKVLARKSQIERYKCSSCHNEKQVLVRNAALLTHGAIELNHGKDGNVLKCIDCHHPEKRDYLEDKKGRKIDFDHSYQLCGQCHFRQKRDWVGGAHGKRVQYWAGERVVYNCTTCHDPHSPRFEKRYPATYAVPLN